MIRYDLVCTEGHSFDGWFRDSSNYDKQAKRGLVSCPHCGSANISKQLMAPGIPAKGNRRSEPVKAPAVPVPAETAAPEGVRMFSGPADPRQQMLVKMVRELRKHVEENAEYVGDKFTDEARKIHY